MGNAAPDDDRASPRIRAEIRGGNALSDELFEIETDDTEAAPALREAQGVDVPDTAGGGGRQK